MSKLIAALIEFHKSVGPIRELSQAQYGAYADLQTVLAAVTPALFEQGLIISQTFRDEHQLITTLAHVSGETMESVTPLIIGEHRKGNMLHAWGGAVTYQRRYAILALLNLAAGMEQDDDADHSDRKIARRTISAPDDDFL